MHQIRFHSAPQTPQTGFKGVVLLGEGKGIGEKGRGKAGRKGRMEEGKEEGCVMAFGGMDAPG